MAGYSARQSSFTTGDTILAAHSNDEFNQVLAAFHATTGHSHDGTAGEGGPISTLRDADSLNKILVDTSNNHLEFYVEVSSAAVQQLRIQDGAIVPITDNDIDLGTSSLEFKDLYVDGTANVDAINLDGTLITSTAAELNILDGVTSTAAELNLVDGITAGTVSASLAVIADSNKDISGFRNVTLTSTLEIDAASGDPTIILDTQGADKFHVAVDDSDSDNLVIKSGGTVGSGSGLKLDSSGNLTVDGDLTVTGDDITMGTNTAGNLLIADGTNFNSIAVGSLSEISSVASDDVLLAVDTSGGGLKKIARSTLVSGLATSSALVNVSEDSTPQLGGDLDVNGNDIVSVSNGNISLLPNGSGVVHVDGNGSSGGVTISDGSIDIRTGTGSIAQMRFFCESSNAHAQTLKAQPHSAGSSSTLTLPAATGTLIGTGDTGTLPLAAMDIDGGTDIGADLTTSDLIVVDDGAGGTNRKAALSRVVTLMTAQGFVTDDPTALAIALG